MTMLMEGSTLREGKYADHLRRSVDWLMDRAQNSGLIGNPNNPTEAARYMYGHGFGLLFLASVYGEEEDADRRKKLEKLLTKAVEFTRKAQTTRGGWGYVSAADGSDFHEGSVTITQIQAHYDPADLVIVSPDVGGVGRARGIAKRLDAQLAIVDKRRERAGVSEVVNVIGHVSGRLCVLVDDIVDSGGTLCNAAQALLEAGATSVAAYVTHGVLSAGAVARIAASRLDELVITDSIRATEAVRVADKIRVITVAPLIGEAIRRISDESSVSSLFD